MKKARIVAKVPKVKEPRTRREKVKKQLTQREKVLRFRRRLVFAFILGSVIFLTVMLGVKPLWQMHSSNQEVKAREARLEQEREKTTSLEEKKQQAGDPLLIEEEARKLGYVMPGEIPIVILEPPATDQSGSDIASDNDTSDNNATDNTTGN